MTPERQSKDSSDRATRLPWRGPSCSGQGRLAFDTSPARRGDPRGDDQAGRPPEL